ncbi:MAG: efflux RND transporter periplasmic adaptor subunit [Bryobacteraceae bacterium]
MSSRLHRPVVVSLEAPAKPGARRSSARATAAFCALLALAACSGPYSGSNVAAKEQHPPIPVTLRPAAVTSIPEIVTATGELFAEELTTVSAKVPGRVERLHADLGSEVRAGDVLAEIDTTDYDFRLGQAQAQVDQIRARLGISGRADDRVTPEETAIVRQAAAALKEARFILDTTTRLQQDGVVSRIDFEKAQVRAQGAEAAYQSAIEEVGQLRAQLTERRAQLELARQQRADCTVRAPFGGGVTRRIASLGEYLPVNAPILTLVRQHPLRLRLEVPERLAPKIRPGQRIEVKLESSGESRSGRVVRLSPALESASRSLVVEGEIPNADGRLRPGSFAEATIVVDPNARGIAVPFSALISFAGVERVFSVENGALSERLVKSGRRLPGEMVEILEGLRSGENFVVKANDRMTHGRAVTVEQGR